MYVSLVYTSLMTVLKALFSENAMAMSHFVGPKIDNPNPRLDTALLGNNYTAWP